VLSPENDGISRLEVVSSDADPVGGGGVVPDERGEAGARFLSPSHPDAVGSWGPAWGAWLSEQGLMDLKPWQQTVLDRGLEHRADGALCWRTCVVSLSRQLGKTFLIRALALCRAALVEGRQDVILTADKALTAVDAMLEAYEWADDEGLRVLKSRGSEFIEWPDRSKWRIVSKLAVYGKSADLYLLDEAFAVSQETFESAIQPTMLARENPQAWVFSAANQDSTELMTVLRRRAIEGSSTTMLAEWGATAGEIDAGGACDPGVWEVSLPPGELTENRRVAYGEQCKSKTFHIQNLNVHPVDLLASRQDVVHWPRGFDSLPLVDSVSAGGVAAFDRSADGMSWDASVAVLVDGRVEVVSGWFAGVSELVEWVLGWEPSRVLAGATVADVVPAGGFGLVPVVRVGVREWAAAMDPFRARVERGGVAHSHSERVLEVTAGAVPRMTEAGLRLSVVRSRVDLSPLKVMQWAVEGVCEAVPLPDRPTIY